MRTRTEPSRELGGEGKAELLGLAGRNSTEEDEFGKIPGNQTPCVCDDREPGDIGTGMTDGRQGRWASVLPNSRAQGPQLGSGKEDLPLKLEGGRCGSSYTGRCRGESVAC